MKKGKIKKIICWIFGHKMRYNLYWKKTYCHRCEVKTGYGELSLDEFDKYFLNKINEIGKTLSIK